MNHRLLFIFLSLWTLTWATAGLNEGVDFFKRLPTPASSTLIESDGSMHLGWYDEPFQNVNPEKGVRSPLAKKYRHKQWEYFSFTSNDIIVGISAVNAGYLANFFVYAFDLKTKAFIEMSQLAVKASKAKISANSVNGETSYRSKLYSVTIQNHYRDGYYDVRFDARDKNGHSLKGDVRVYVSGESYVNSKEVGPHRIVYTHQNSLFRPEGRVEWDGVIYPFKRDRDFSSFDFTNGMHAYKTEWNWASASGLADDGATISINLSAYLGGIANEKSIYWVNGKIYRRGDIVFSYKNIDDPWIIESKDGAIKLRFVPLGKRVGNTNVGIIVSKFAQPFGLFSGTVRDPNGVVHTIHDMPGVVEEHWARW